MYEFTLSAFADEIDPSLSKQIEVLKKNGIHHMELRSIEGKNVSDFETDYAKKIKNILDENGIGVSAIGSPIGKIPITDSFDAHFEKFKHVVELAKIFGTKYIRMFSFFFGEADSYEENREKVLHRILQFTDYVKDTDIVLLHENEKGIYGDTAVRCYDILSTIQSPKLRCTFDPANFVQCKQAVYPEAFEHLKDYVEYIHIKDAILESGEVVPAGKGDSNLPQLLDRLKRDGYQGFLSLEPHLGNFQGFASLEQGNDIQFSEDSDEFKFKIAADALKALL